MEAWILAGTLDGRAARPALLDEVAGIPHLLRLACDAALAGATRIYILWDGARPLPDLSGVLTDERIAKRAAIEIVTRSPGGAAEDAVLVIRADRIFHRDLPRAAIAARAAGRIGVVAGAEHDAVFATDRATAHELARAAPEPGGLAAAVARFGTSEAKPPYLAFTTAAADRRALRRAERTLVWSLRKSADGLAAKWVNRHVSLRLSWLLMRTPVHPNHVTVAALVLALLGAVAIAHGAAVWGFVLVNLGSIIDGCDGELARLRYQFSRTGQWLDTIVDDLANVAYASGIAFHLHGAGVTWAAPLATGALLAFASTQLTQYALLRWVYRSGDLAAIPWAMQSTEQLSGRGLRSFVPKLFKRDFVLVVMLGLAIAGRLDAALVLFAAGAAAFAAMFWAQAARYAFSR